MVAVIAHNLAFLCGAVLAVLLLLTIYDEDVITVEHVLTIMTVLGAIVAGCRIFIPEENLVWCPETLMEAILAQVHYLPPGWKGQAHTAQVQVEFSQLFQFKALFLFQELISPLVTPFVLYFVLRPRALEVVDFLRQFTVEVVGVGDVCSFAQLDLYKHRHPQWFSAISSEVSDKSSLHEEQQLESEPLCQPAEDGKTELSLIHFALTNPEWRPSKAAEGFLTALRSQIQQEMATNPMMFQPNIFASYSAMGGAESPAMQSLMRPNFFPTHDQQWKSSSLIGRGIIKSEGPRSLPENGSFHNSSQRSNSESFREGMVIASEPVAVNMAVSTLYLHDLIHRRNQPQRLNANIGQLVMPGIRESPYEDEQHHTENAAAALMAAVDNLSSPRMAKSN